MGLVEQVVDLSLAYPIASVILLLGVFVGALSMFFSGPKLTNSPFRLENLKTPKPYVADLKARDAVIKQGFAPKKIPENLDAIVIGSGIGGLTTANILARAGKKCLVLEQHDQAGGCCHTFIDKGFEFDVGIHYIGEMTGNSPEKMLISQITDNQLVWDNLDHHFDVVALGDPREVRRYPIPSGGMQQWKKEMLVKFPEEEAALDHFLRLCQGVKDNIMGFVMLRVMPKFLARILISTGLLHLITRYFKYASRTTQDVMDEITPNKELQAVMCYNFGDYASLPKDSSFAMQAFLFLHFMEGAVYPRGGSSEIAFHIIPAIERAGGKVLVRAPVSQILTNESGKAIGVRVKRTSGDIDIHAPIIVSNAGIINTMKNMLPEEVAMKSEMYHLLKTKLKSGQAALSLFVGLEGTTEELKLEANNTWAFVTNDLNKTPSDYLKLNAEEAAGCETPMMFVGFPSAKDSTWSSRYPGKSVCTVVTLVEWEWFSKWENERVMKRGDEYDYLKNEIGNRLWEQVCLHWPQLQGKDVFMEVGSPVTNTHYIAAPKGEMYGLDHDFTRIADPNVLIHLRPETGIPGLYITGQDIFTGGFLGGAMGGMVSASVILNRNLYDDLIYLTKQAVPNGKKDK